MITSPHVISVNEAEHVFIIFQRLFVISSRLLKCILQKEHRGQDNFRRQEKVMSNAECEIKIVTRDWGIGALKCGMQNADCGIIKWLGARVSCLGMCDSWFEVRTKQKKAAGAMIPDSLFISLIEGKFIFSSSACGWPWRPHPVLLP